MDIKYSKGEIKTQQDAQRVIDELLVKRNEIIEKGPQLVLAIAKAPYYLGVLFEKDGTSNYDIRICSGYKKDLIDALRKPNRKYNGEIYFGDLCRKVPLAGSKYTQYLIKINPLFLTDDELSKLEQWGSLTKKIGQCDITFADPKFFSTLAEEDALNFPTFSQRVERYKKEIPEFRALIQQIDSAIEELKALKKTLPMGEEVDMQDETGFSI